MESNRSILLENSGQKFSSTCYNFNDVNNDVKNDTNDKKDNSIKFVYFLENAKLEDIRIILDKNQAIEISKKNSDKKIHIFTLLKDGTYNSTFQFYKNGVIFILQ